MKPGAARLAAMLAPRGNAAPGAARLEPRGNAAPDAARLEPRGMKPGARCTSKACANQAVPGAQAKPVPQSKRMSCAQAQGSITTTSTSTTTTTIPKPPPPRQHPPPPPWLARFHHKLSTAMHHGPVIKLSKVISHLWIRGYLKHTHGLEREIKHE